LVGNNANGDGDTESHLGDINTVLYPSKAEYMDWTGNNVLICDLTSTNTDAAVVVVPLL